MRAALAAVLLVGALLLPGPVPRLPVEALAGLVLLLVLPPRAGRIVATAGGALVGLLAVLAALHLGFGATLGRPFDPVVDASLLGDAGRFVAASTGPPAAVALAVAVGLVALAAPVAGALAARCVAGAVARHRAAAARALAVVVPVTLLAALAGLPVASASAASLAARTAVGVPATLAGQREFAAQLAADPFAAAPGRLDVLRGTDVVVAFVESYGRIALDAPQVTDALDAGTGRLAAAGYGVRSGFLTSPVAGGSSWLAHDTFLSGLRVDDPARHRALVGSDRLTLPRAFRDAGWGTVAVMPGTTGAWPEAAFFGHDRVLDLAALGYRGPDLGWATVPDQYTLAAFERTRRGAPVFAEVALVSGHAPWPFTPPVLDWAAVGDGSVYGPMAPPASERDAIWAQGPERVRAAYAGATAYTLETLVSYVEEFGDERELVLVLLGDHQPLPAVAGKDAGRDVPVSIVSRSPDVLDRAAAWGWTDGLRPPADAPVWPMEAVRDRFLATFSAPAPVVTG